MSPYSPNYLMNSFLNFSSLSLIFLENVLYLALMPGSFMSNDIRFGLSLSGFAFNDEFFLLPIATIFCASCYEVPYGFIVLRGGLIPIMPARDLPLTEPVNPPDVASPLSFLARSIPLALPAAMFSADIYLF